METLLETLSHELRIPEEDLLREGMRALLERQLRDVKVGIFEITGRYGVASVEEMESLYRQGTLDEALSLKDFQRLDHLEYKRDQLIRLLASVA